MSDRRLPGPDTIELPFIFVPDGEPMPDAARHFREPIVLRARFEPGSAYRNAPPSEPVGGPLRVGVTTLPGSAAPIPVRGGPAERAPQSFADTPVKLIAAGGTLLAWGTPGQILANASMLAAAESALPAVLAVAGTALVFYTVAALLDHLAQMAGDRNAGLPGPLRAKSERARASARAADEAVADALNRDEWSAHHFIGVQAARQHQTILEAAARVGWVMDEPDNVIALPRTFAAQAKLARAGIHRPVHDNAT